MSQQHKSLAIIYCCYNSKVFPVTAHCDIFASGVTGPLSRTFDAIGVNLYAETKALSDEGVEKNTFRAHVARRDDARNYILELTSNSMAASEICKTFRNSVVHYFKTTSCSPKTIVDPSLLSMGGRCDSMISTHTHIYGYGYQTIAEQLAMYFFLCRTHSTADMNFTFKVVPENKYTDFTATTRNMEDEVDCGVRRLQFFGFIYFFLLN